MNKRKTSPTFEIKELYRISDIVAYTKDTMSRQEVRRMIQRSSVVLFRQGRSIYITIDEFRLKMPTLWDSLVSAKVTRQDDDASNLDYHVDRPDYDDR